MQNPFAFAKTPALDPTQAMDTYSLGQKQALINALRQAAINPPQAQQMGTIASRTSPITPIVQALMGYKAGKDQDALNSQFSNLAKQQQAQTLSMMGGGQPAQPMQQAPQPSPEMQNPLEPPPDPNAAQLAQALAGPQQQQAPQPVKSPMNPGGLDPKMAAQLYSTLGPKEYSSQYIEPYNDPKAKQAQTNWEADHALKVAAASKEKQSPTADGLVWDGKNYKDPDGNVLNAEQVRQWKANLTGARADATNKSKTAIGTSLSDQAVDLAARRMQNGEKARDVLANFGRGTQGAADIRAVQNRFAALAAESGTDAADIATRVQELSAEGRTRTELGAREGKIAPRVQEAQNFAKIALEASKNVPRGNSTDWNKLIQFKDAHFSDPALAKFHAANVSLINAYAAAVGAGSPTVHDKEVGETMLRTVAGQKGYEAAVQQILTETQAALDAPKQVMESMRNKDKKGVPPPTNSKGWALHVDASGNKAYVGPNNEIEEVQ